MSRLRTVLLRLLALALLVAIVLAAITGVRLYRQGQALLQRVTRVQALVSGDGARSLDRQTLASLQQELTGAQRDYLTLKQTAAPFFPIVARLGWLPRVGPTLAAAPHLAAMGEHLLDAGVTLFDSVDPLLETALGAPGSSQAGQSITERLLPLLLSAQPRFVAAQDATERAVAARAAIDTSRLLPPLARQMDRLDKYLPALRTASQAAAISPILLGAVRPMNYLLVAQNNDELRPTGGFISAAGILTLDRGKITRLDLKDSGSIDNWTRDHPQPPEQLTRFMLSELWVLRDANFWPDFPTSARALDYFAELDLDLQPDGIIAIDQLALQILVGGFGSVVVPEFDNDVLTKDNVVSKIRTYWQPSQEFAQGVQSGEVTKWKEWLPWYGERKQFMTYLVQAMRARLEQDPRSINMAQMGKAILQALDEKHILVYLQEPLGAGLDSTRWGGAIAQTASDYLLAVDTNMGFNKANGVVDRRLDYTVSIDAQGLARSQVTISYHNTSTRTVECLYESYYEPSYDLMMNRCYWNYLRVYVPAGSTLIAEENGNDMEQLGIESGKQVWAMFMVVAPGEQPRVTLGYYSPESVLQRTGDAWEYHMTVQKQPGTDRTPLHVAVTLPAGMTMISASPAPARVEGSTITFQSNLSTDQEFRILMR